MIAQSEQLELEPRAHLFEPMELSGSTKLTLTPWPKYTDEKHVLLHSDSLLTVVEPNDKVRDAYLAKIGKTVEDFIPEPEPQLLQEEEQLPQQTFDYDEEDEYEPRYTEED